MNIKVDVIGPKVPVELIIVGEEAANRNDPEKFIRSVLTLNFKSIGLLCLLDWGYAGIHSH